MRRFLAMRKPGRLLNDDEIYQVNIAVLYKIA